MFIYKITNNLNNKCYIGQTIHQAEERWKRHQQDALSNRLDTHFARAIRLYGVENFSLEVIDTANSQEELTHKESYWIKYYDSINNGYNETFASEKCGGNTYFTKTESELELIGEKIAKTKQGGLNINATPVKCRNINTGEELFFNSQSEMQSFFNASNHLFISRRCLGHIKKPYLGIWEIAYANKEYGESSLNPQETIKKSKVKYIIVKKLSTGEEKQFTTYAEAERYFNVKSRGFSSKASKKPQTFIYNYEYQISKYYD